MPCEAAYCRGSILNEPAATTAVFVWLWPRSNVDNATALDFGLLKHRDQPVFGLVRGNNVLQRPSSPRR